LFSFGTRRRPPARGHERRHADAQVDDTRLLGRAVNVAGELGVRNGRCEERANAGPCGAQPLCEVALWHQFEFDTAVAVQLVEHEGVGLTGKAADDLAHAAGLKQCCHQAVAIAGVVVHDGPVPSPLVNQTTDQLVGNPRSPEAADQHCRTVAHVGQRSLDGGGDFVDHVGSLDEEGSWVMVG
jgi:hypothetical protein